MFPDKPVTKSPAETRMGKGKGAPEYSVAVVKPAVSCTRFEGVDENDCARSDEAGVTEAAVKTKFVTAPSKKGRDLSFEFGVSGFELRQEPRKSNSKRELETATKRL